MSAYDPVTVRTFLGDRITLHAGDCLAVLAELPEHSVDSVVCDPPYHLQAIHKRFAAKGRDETSERYAAGPYGRTAKGFMGKQWDGGDIAFRVELWEQVLRVLKPGGHLVAFSGTRTYHRMVCAIEDAGFEIRDQIGWAFGSGFPKSHDVSKGIDKSRGLEREVIRERYTAKRIKPGATVVREGAYGKQDISFTATDTAPASEDAATWQGWGTALKPAWEPICLARRPLIGTVAENVLEHGTGAINIAGCRVETDDDKADGGACKLWSHYRDGEASANRRYQDRGATNFAATPGPRGGAPAGRWPANLIHDGSDEVLAAFPDSDGQQARVTGDEPTANGFSGAVAFGGMRARIGGCEPRNDSGSAARFFYTAKADSEDRLGSKHPTVKPLDLMQWLVRLVTPKGGVVADPFAGTGTTGEAAWREGMRAVLIEREPEYQADIARRMELAGNPTKRSAVAKSKNNLERPESLPLFAIPEAAE